MANSSSHFDVGDDMDERFLQVEGGPDDPNPFEKKKRKKKSKVWEDFIIVTLPNGKKMLECMHCKEKLSVMKSGTTSHLGCNLANCLKKKLAEKGQSMLNFQPVQSEVEAPILSSGKYDHGKQREVVAHWILTQQRVFNVVEDYSFTFMFKVNLPQYEKINRTQAKNDCVAVYAMEPKKLKSLLMNVKKISLTTDLWKSEVQQSSYMCVTGHFVDVDWKFQKRVMSFVPLPPPHLGIEIADSFSKCVKYWGLDGKVFTISVDNTSNNHSDIKILKQTFSGTQSLPLEGKLFHVRCCAHILNLVVQDGLSKIKKIIEKVKESMSFLNKSESRILKFSEIVHQMNLGGKKLIYDFSTRWNSTYEMLASALKVKAVFPVYEDKDLSYSLCPTLEEWKKAEQVLEILEILYEATQVISGSDYRTSNQFLPVIWRVKEVLNTKILDENHFIKSMVEKNENQV